MIKAQFIKILTFILFLSIEGRGLTTPNTNMSFNFSEYLCKDLKKQIQNNQESISYRSKINPDHFILNIRLYEIFNRYNTCFSTEIQKTHNLQLNDLRINFDDFKNLLVKNKEQRQARAIELFNKSKSLVEIVLNKNPETKNLSHRTNTIRLETINKCGMFNASYNPLSHTISLCSEILDFPDSTLISIISHEIGHSIDPCLLQLNLSQITNENPFFNKTKVIYPNELDNAYTTIPSEWAESDFFIEKQNFILIQQGLKFEQNPFNKVMNCLTQQNSIEAQLSEKSGVCADGNKDGEFQEVFADWLSTEAFDVYLNLMDTNLNENNFYNANIFKNQSKFEFIKESPLNFLVAECKNIETQSELILRKVMESDPNCNAQTQSYFKQLDAERSGNFKSSHPHSYRRVNKLFAAHPNIQQVIKTYAKEFKPDSEIKDKPIHYCHF